MKKLGPPRSSRPRTDSIGASEIAAVAGLVPGAISVYARKVGDLPETVGGDLAEFGQRFEGPIVDAWRARHPGHDTFTPGTLYHPAQPICSASPDRIVVPPRRRARTAWESALEVKHVTWHGERWEAGIPERVLAQVQFQLEVTGLPAATVVAFVAGRYLEALVERDTEVGQMLVEVAVRFWTDHVVARVPPAPDGTDAYRDYLRGRHPVARAPALPSTDLARSLAARLAEAKDAVRATLQHRDALQQELELLIGEAEGIEGVCTWRNNRESRTIEYEAAYRALAPRVFTRAVEAERYLEQFTTTKPGARVLRLTRSDE